MKFTIKLAEPSDAERCAEIHKESWFFAYGSYVDIPLITQYTERFPAMWGKMLAVNTNTQYVITLDDTIIGFVGLMRSRDTDLPENTFEIGAIYLDPTYIGNGYGKQAIAWAIDEFLSRGAKQISLWVLDYNHRAKRFYQTCGFVPDGASKPSGLGERLEERMIYKF